MKIPLKTAVRMRSGSMVSLLLHPGTVPMSSEEQEANEFGGNIAAIASSAYSALPERGRF
jgi:hypothetical protein